MSFVYSPIFACIANVTDFTLKNYLFQCSLFSVNMLLYFPGVLTPFSSDRQHLSYDDCLEVRGEIIRTVLCCIVY